jgi:hypothetical protein
MDLPLSIDPARGDPPHRRIPEIAETHDHFWAEHQAPVGAYVRSGSRPRAPTRIAGHSGALATIAV